GRPPDLDHRRPAGRRADVELRHRRPARGDHQRSGHLRPQGGADLPRAGRALAAARTYHRRMIHVRGFDHLVLRVADVERSLAWYLGVLGLEPVRVEEWRRGTVPFPSVRIDAGTIIDLLASDRPDGPQPSGNV